MNAGIDIGALTAKAVIVDDGSGRVAGKFLLPTGATPEAAGNEALAGALELAGLERTDIAASVATGYGRGAMKGVDWRITEISCHARGAREVVEEVRTVIDLGGQDAKVIVLDEAGGPMDFEMNDRCAAGTGRFLEVMAQALGISLQQLGELAVNASEAVSLSSTCTVFAESEVIGLLAEQHSVAAIAAGLCEAVARRTVQMTNRLKVVGKVVLCGGVALNEGVEKAMSEVLGMEVIVPPEPEFVGALGAAMIAGERRE